ncbi:MAG: hypothetical protein AAGD14_05410 [Planctomycetota bacterium]
MRTTALLLLFAAFAVGQAKPSPELLVLEIDGVEIPMVAGEAKTITVQGKEVSARVSMRDYRVFERPWAKFRFPRRCKVNEEKLGVATSWTINGNDSYVQILRIPGSTEREGVESIADSLRGKRAPEPIVLKLGKRTCKGLRVINDDDASAATRSDIVAFESGKAVYVVHFFDALDEGNRPTAEFERLLRVVTASFELPNVK